MKHHGSELRPIIELNFGKASYNSLMWWTLNTFYFSVVLIKTIPSLVKQEWILLFLFNFLPQNAMDSFARVKFSLIKILLFWLKLYFIWLLILISFFQFTNAFLQYLRLINLTMVFLLEVFGQISQSCDTLQYHHFELSPFWTITS